MALASCGVCGGLFPGPARGRPARYCLVHQWEERVIRVRRARPHSTKPLGDRSPQRTIAIILAYQQPNATLAAIGQAHGISRERVRQIVRRAGLEGRTLKGFEALDPAEFRRRTSTAQVVRGGLGAASLRRYRSWRRQAVADLMALAAQLGRVPTYTEACAPYGITLTEAGRRWIGRSQMHKPKMARGVRRWYRLAGLIPRSRGSPGHILPG